VRDEQHSRVSWAIPQEAKPGPGQDGAGHGPRGHRRDGGKFQCETRALPAPYTGEEEEGAWRSCILWDTLLDGARRLLWRLDCARSSTAGLSFQHGVDQGTCARPGCATPSSPHARHSRLLPGPNSGCSVPCWALLPLPDPQGSAGQTQASPLPGSRLRAEPAGRIYSSQGWQNKMGHRGGVDKSSLGFFVL